MPYVLRALSVALSLLPLATPAHAVTDDAQIWTTLAVNVKLSDKWRLSNELVGRFSDNRNGLYEIEDDLLLGYQINKTVGVWAGYVHDPQYSEGHFSVMERRAREQVVFSKIAKLAGGTIDTRARFEQRWRDGKDGTAWRFRPWIRWTLPIANGGRTNLVVSHESFISFNKTSFQGETGYNRMRNLIAISTPLTKRVNAEIGYLNQYSTVHHGPDTMDHVASVTLSVSM